MTIQIHLSWLYMIMFKNMIMHQVLRYFYIMLRCVILCFTGPKRWVGAPTVKLSLFGMITNILQKLDLIPKDQGTLPMTREWTSIFVFPNPSKYLWCLFHTEHTHAQSVHIRQRFYKTTHAINIFFFNYTHIHFQSLLRNY